MKKQVKKPLPTSHFPLPKKGAALVTSLIVLLFLCGVGLALVVWLMSESNQATHKKLVTADLYLAEAGSEKAIYLLKSPGITLTDTTFSAPWTNNIATNTITVIWSIQGTSVTVTIDHLP